VFCLAWGVLALALLSLFDVKQPQYLLPLIPAAALATTWLLFEENLVSVAEERAIAGLMAPVVVIGALLAVLPKLPPAVPAPPVLRNLSPLVGVCVMVVGFALGWLPHRPVRQRARDMAIITVVLAVFVLLGVASQFDRFYEVGDVAQFLGDAGRNGRPLAYVGHYDGQYDFAGRLPQPLAVLGPDQVAAWSDTHPDGLLVTDSTEWQPPTVPGERPAYRSAGRDREVVVWAVNAVAATAP
jgi:4-amino-4-deoxy-L-arabinose transferase-like glycosyltransferase